MKGEKLMKLKKTVALLMAGTLLAGMLAGCNSAPSGGIRRPESDAFRPVFRRAVAG